MQDSNVWVSVLLPVGDVKGRDAALSHPQQRRLSLTCAAPQRTCRREKNKHLSLVASVNVENIRRVNSGKKQSLTVKGRSK